MPEMNGVDFLTALRTLQPDCERIILSGYADLNALVRAVNEARVKVAVPERLSCTVPSPPERVSAPRPCAVDAVL